MKDGLERYSVGRKNWSKTGNWIDRQEVDDSVFDDDLKDKPDPYVMGFVERIQRAGQLRYAGATKSFLHWTSRPLVY